MPGKSEWTEQILRKSGVLASHHWISPRTQFLVFRTQANQLVGSYSALSSFRNAFPEDYKKQTGSRVSKLSGRPENFEQKTWEVHHIVEIQDLRVLECLGRKLPSYRYLPCVLLPYEAHQERINDLLERGPNSTMSDLLDYANAYDAIGSYNGADEDRIRNELVAICRMVIETPLEPDALTATAGSDEG